MERKKNALWLKKKGKKISLYKKKSYLCMRKQNDGALTEWLGSGLQNRPQQFESAGHLEEKDDSVLTVIFFCLLQTECLLSGIESETCQK